MNNPFKKDQRFTIGLILTVADGLLSGSSYMVLYLVIRMLSGDQITLNEIMAATGFLVGIFLVRVLIHSIGYTQSQIGGAGVSKNIRLFLGDKFKRIPLSRFTKGQVGEYVNTMTTDVNNYEQILTHKINNLVKNITLLVVVTVFISALYLPAGIVVLLSALLLIPEMYLSFRTVKKYGVSKNRISSEAVSSIVEYIDGIQTFRAYGLGGTKNKATTEAMQKFSQVNYEFEAHSIPITFSFSIINWLVVPLVMGIGLTPWKMGEISGVNYLFLCMFPMLSAKLISGISIDLFSYRNLKISHDNILKIAQEKEESGSAEAMQLNQYEIELKHVDFSYVPEEKVLKDISFAAPNGKLTAIVGNSGSGKSTILNLISKYYEVDSGEIFIGGKSINNVSAERVLEQISMVDQDVFLFNDSIKENIRHARPTATDAEIKAACCLANCDDFIQRSEKGYDTQIGENGSLISGGERQRISIARAILKDSPIILLDEATASLDIENELAVKKAILNLISKKRTVIMIAHTLSIIRNADKIIVIDDGKVVEEGTHKELLDEKGKYFAMWTAEQKSFC